MKAEELRAWARQPTTVAGFSAMIATMIALGLKQLTWVQAVPLVAGAVASMIMPDDSAAGQQARVLASEFVSEIIVHKDKK